MPRIAFHFSHPFSMTMALTGDAVENVKPILPPGFTP
jgi:hypothetical protein